MTGDYVPIAAILASQNPDANETKETIHPVTPDGQPYTTSTPGPPKALASEKFYRKDGRKQLLFVSSNSCIGGVEKVVLNLLKNLDREKYHITTIVTRLRGPFEKYYIEYSDVFYHMTANTDFRNFLNQNRFDIYHIFNSLLAIASIDYMTGDMVVLATFGDWRWEGHWYTIRKDRFLEMIDRINVITCDNPVNVPLFYDFPIHVRNGIEFPEKPKRKSLRPPVVVWAGRDSGEKCPESVIETARRMPEVEFHVAISDLMSGADGSFNIQRMKAMKNIKLTINANQEQVKEMMDNACIYFNTSSTEGMPMAFLEAMTYGCYPVVSDVGDMPDLIEKVGHGIVSTNKPATQKDYSKDIRQAIANLKKGPVKIPREIIKNVGEYHHIDKYIEQIEEIYQGKLYRDKTKISVVSKRHRNEKRPELKRRIHSFLEDVTIFHQQTDSRTPHEYAEKLYMALFDLNLTSNRYWYEICDDMSKSEITEKFLLIFFESIARNVFESVKEMLVRIEGMVGVEWPILDFVRHADAGINFDEAIKFIITGKKCGKCGQEVYKFDNNNKSFLECGNKKCDYLERTA